MTCFKRFMICFLACAETALASDDPQPPRRINIRQDSIPVKPKSGLIQTDNGLELNLSRTDTNDATLLFMLGDPTNSKIRSINVSYTSISANSFYKIAQLNALKRLTIKAIQIYMGEIAILSHLTALTSLDLSECKTLKGDLTWTLRERLGHLPLESLRLEKLAEECTLKLENLLPTQKVFRNLRRLSISHSYVNEAYDATLPLESFEARGLTVSRYIANLPSRSSNLKLVTKDTSQLKRFNLAQEGFHVEFREIDLLKSISEEVSLPNRFYSLEITESYNSREEPSKRPDWFKPNIQINNLPCLYAGLRLLDLSENNLIDDCLIPLGSLNLLQALHLDGNPVTQRCLPTLESLPLLELSLRRTFVADYQDEGGKRTPLGLKFPATLQRLLLDESLIEGHTFPTIYKLEYLKTLSILKTPLCDQGVELVFTCPRFINIKITAGLNARESELSKSKGKKWTSAAKFTIK